MQPLPEQVGFTTTYFELPGLRMHAAVAGPTDGPLVILLHGFPEFWYGWQHAIGALAGAGFRVIAPDQRGYNLTSKQPPYDLRTLTDDIVHLMDAAGYPAAYVAGHDWGGAVAWCLAAWYPERVLRLAVANLPHPLAFQSAFQHFNLRQYLRSLYAVFFQIPAVPEWLMRRRDFGLMRKLPNYTVRPDAFTAGDMDRYVSAWSQPGALTAMLGWYRAFGRSGQQVAATRAQFEVIKPRTLILWGERDVALGIELAEASVPYLADGRLVRFPQSTHWLLAELPDQVNEHLLQHFGGPRA
jgi:pimeloyl-ACP methyl ester carboxylesterase